MIQIVGARWRRHGNELRLRCECGGEWWHRADRWLAQCVCGIGESLRVIRARYHPDDDAA